MNRAGIVQPREEDVQGNLINDSINVYNVCEQTMEACEKKGVGLVTHVQGKDNPN